MCRPAAKSAAGWPSGKSLALIANAAPAAARAPLTAVAESLAKGETPDAGTDPLARILARGEAAGADALLEAARAFETQERALQAAHVDVKGTATVGGIFDPEQWFLSFLARDNTNTLPLYAFLRAYTGMEFSYGASLALILTAFLLAIVWLYVRRASRDLDR